jgi:hypothetical protein
MVSLIDTMPDDIPMSLRTLPLSLAAPVAVTARLRQHHYLLPS